MAALTKGRNTKRSVPGLRTFPVKGGVKIYEGSIVSIGSDGYARPGRTSTTDVCVGRAEAEADASLLADGAISVSVLMGEVAYFANSSAGDAIANTDIGADCYVVDDQTVAKTNGTSTRIRAGKVYFVSSTDGVGVRFDQ